MVDDAELLQRYSGSGVEAAFTELVQRHVNLVYFTALRRTCGDAALAKDITQSVFSTAARKARDLTNHLSLTGWFYTTTRHLSDKAVKKEQTRRHYEQNAAMDALTTAESSPEWERVRPIIDGALEEMAERDREVILMRFFQSRGFADIGATLQISDDAARMRVDRALEKMKKLLHRRGLPSTAAALAVALSAQGTVTVPAGMAAAVSGAAIASAGAAGGLALVFGFMSITKTTAITATLAAIVASGVAVVEHNRAQSAETELTAITQDRSSLRASIAQAENRVAQAHTRAEEADRDSASLLVAVDAARAKQMTLPRASVSSSPLPQSLVNDPLAHSLHAMFPNGIVATVGEKTITVDEIRRELQLAIPKLQQEVHDPNEFNQRLYKLQNGVVTALVERSLLIKEFSIPNKNEPPRNIPETWIDQTLKETLKEQFSNDPAKFAAYLESQGMTRDQYRKTVEENIAYSYMRQQQRNLGQK